MIVRTPHRDRFVIIDKTALEDSRLSWRARGLLAYLLTKPDHWRVLVAQLVSAGPDGRTSVRAGLSELEDAGYITRSQGRRDGGQWDSADVQVFEKPQVTTAVGKPDSGRDLQQCTHEVTKVQVATAVGFPDDGFADAGKTPPSENRLIVKTENSFSPCVRDALHLVADRPVEEAKRRAVAEAPPARRTDSLFNALTEALGIDPAELTPSARGAMNKALADLRRVGADADEIHERAAVYRRLYPHAALTPSALARHWPQLIEKNVRASSPVGRALEVARRAGR